MVIKYKVKDLAADFNLNTKATIAQLSELFGTEVKRSTELSDTQADLAFEFYSKNGRIDNFAEYLAPKKEAKPVEKTEKKQEKKTLAKSEAKPCHVDM